MQLFDYSGILRGGGLKGCCYFGCRDWEIGIEKSQKKQASAVFVLPPLHMNDVSAGERSSRTDPEINALEGISRVQVNP